MARFDYDDRLSFILPNSIEVEEEVDESGEKKYSLNVGLYLDDDGEIQSRFKASFGSINVTKPDPKTVSVKEICEDLVKATEGLKYYAVSGDPECMFINIPMPVSILSQTLNLSRHIFAVRVSPETMISVGLAIELNDDNPERVRQFYKDMLEIARSVRVSGEPIPLGDLTPEQLQEAIHLTFDEDSEVIDITSGIRVEVTRGDEKVSFRFGEDELEEDEGDTSSSSGWGQNIMIEGDESGSEAEDYSSGTSWGSGITIEGDGSGSGYEESNSDVAWGSGMTIDGKPVK